MSLECVCMCERERECLRACVCRAVCALKVDKNCFTFPLSAARQKQRSQ